MNFGPINVTFNTFRFSFTPDGQGGFNNDSTLYLSGIQGRIEYLTGREKVEYGKEAVDCDVMIYCGNVNIDESDRIFMNTIDYPNQYFDVKLVNEVRGFNGISHLEVLCRELRQEDI
jgi:hypothetical protein